jgi:hypothetical protein
MIKMEAVDNNLMRESNPLMPISNPSRQTKVTLEKVENKLLFSITHII